MSFLTQYLLGITNSKCISKGCGKGSVSFSKRFVWGWWELSKIEICQKKVFLIHLCRENVLDAALLKPFVQKKNEDPPG